MLYKWLQKWKLNLTVKLDINIIQYKRLNENGNEIKM